MKFQFKKVFVAVASFLMLASCSGKTPTHSHTYGDPSWNWDGYNTAVATFTCSSCSAETEGHTSKVNAKVTSAVTKEATCLESGVKTYTASVDFNSKTYTNAKEETLAPLGHTYGSPTWAWNGLESAKATFVCSLCSEQTEGHSVEINAYVSNKVTENPTCATSGIRTYTASVEFKGTPYEDHKEETIAPLGHHYGQPTWAWTNFESAVATFVCSECGSEEEGHSVDVNATITNEVTKDPTCATSGEKTYTATVEFDGSTYIDTKTDSIDPKGHKYGEPTWSWTGLTAAKATFVCGECGAEESGHSVDVDATITNEVTTEPTCTTSGVKTYTASLVFEGKTYTDAKEETLAPLGHSYGTPTWTWTNYTAAKATFVCSECQETVEGHSVDVDATITNTHTDGTCIAKGHNDYKATVTFKGTEYTDTKVEELSYGNHAYGEYVETKAPTYEEEGVETRTCSVCKDTDTRSIPKLVAAYADVKPILVAASTKDSLNIYSGDAYEDALIWYSRLDFANMSQTEKDEAAGLKASVEALKTSWKKLFSKAFDVKNIGNFNDTKCNYLTDISQARGHMMEIHSTKASGEGFTYTADLKLDVGDAEYVQFGFYQDQPGDLLAINAAWTKSLNLLTGEISDGVVATKGLKNKDWNNICIPAKTWEEMGNFNIGIYLMGGEAGYGIKTGGEPAFMTSIYTSKSPTEEGFPVIKGAHNITDVQTWGATAATTEIKYGVETAHGTATQVDIKAKTSVLELKWENADYTLLKNYDYARMYVYAKTTQRVFVSLNNWRCNVVSLPNVDPFASDVGAQADAVQSTANVVADQWNIIDIPTAYFAKDTDNAFYVQIWADKNEAKDGWLFCDIVGHNGSRCLDNGGQLIAHNTSATVAEASDETYGGVSRATLAAAQGYVKQNRNTDISQYKTLTFKVKNEATSKLSLLLFKLNDSVYGNAVKGSYLTVELPAGQWTDVSISITDYFGTNASTSKIYFRVDGTAGSSCLFTAIYAE